MAKRRTFTPEFKARVVLELISGSQSSAEVCRQYRLKPQLLSRWKAEFIENAARVFRSNEQRSQEEARIAELERLVRRQSLELEVLKKSVQGLGITPRQRRTIIQELAEEYSVSLLCQVLECPRSTFYYQAQSRDDKLLQDAIEEVTGARPTYGYRRIMAQIRRDRKWTINSKRVRRIMRLMRLLRRSKRRGRRTTNSTHPFPRYPNLVQDLAVRHPDHVWVADGRPFGRLVTGVWTNKLLGLHFTKRANCCKRGYYEPRKYYPIATVPGGIVPHFHP